MKVNFNTNLNFKRKLTPKEEADYQSTLKAAKKKIGANGRSMLIIPASSLPEDNQLCIGIGNLGSKKSEEFFDFIKKYWGINEVQILPMGQYHHSRGEYPIYSGTSLDLGNHVINPQLFNIFTEEELTQLKNANKIKDRINYSNIVDENSIFENLLKNSYKRFINSGENNKKLREEFTKYKAENKGLLEQKSLYSVLRKLYNTHNFNKWNDIDKNLFNNDKINQENRRKRVEYLNSNYSEDIDFYKFKQFLAEKSLEDARKKMNEKGIKLSGDLMCGFSYDEVWANPKAFRKDCSLPWGLPVLETNSKEAEDLLRKKVNLYAKRFDNLRIDASWIYVNPTIRNDHDNTLYKEDYGDKFLKIIDDEILKVKGKEYNLDNITHEFAATVQDFTIFNKDGNLKDYVKTRTQIHTSQYMNTDWGTNKSFLEKGWNPDKFIIGTTNHDSVKMQFYQPQADILSEILKIPVEKISNEKEFVKAKFAETMSAKNNMLFFMDAFDLPNWYKGNKNPELNYTSKLSSNYQDKYFENLTKGKCFNPMDSLEKIFKSKNLDKSEKDLYKKIVKYRKILEEQPKKNKHLGTKVIIGTLSAILLGTLTIKSLLKNHE